MDFYSAVIRPLVFRMDPEYAHQLTIQLAARMRWASSAMRVLFASNNARLKTEVSGIRFANPIGLAAGFDKSGVAVSTLAGLGFGFVEIGSISIDPSAGNPPPRLFRLPDDHAIVVHYGLPNDGALSVAARLDATHLGIPLGVNLVKTNRGIGAAPETKNQIVGEYVRAVGVFARRADYLMLNLSCPNTEDGRDFFAERANLEACLAAIGEIDIDVPVFLKVSPLGGIAAIETLLEVVEPHPFVSGFMFNLSPLKPASLRSPETVWRSMPGAVSGRPAAAIANECIRETFRRMDRKRYSIIGAGGIFTAEDAYVKIRLGASLVQVLTALVYEGPGVVRHINQGLARLLERDGLDHVSQAVGIDALGAKKWHDDESVVFT
ncbi:MAG: quinone-dependent dihydroorotate dehydrogenase [Rhizobiales bacterium]|nr:quinone-dependent dihydroorotate dehydrogenase [Hyphomicrobiales bacterium]